MGDTERGKQFFVLFVLFDEEVFKKNFWSSETKFIPLSFWAFKLLKKFKSQ